MMANAGEANIQEIFPLGSLFDQKQFPFNLMGSIIVPLDRQ